MYQCITTPGDNADDLIIQIRGKLPLNARCHFMYKKKIRLVGYLIADSRPGFKLDTNRIFAHNLTKTYQNHSKPGLQFAKVSCVIAK